jgi:hypothetical protein
MRIAASKTKPEMPLAFARFAVQATTTLYHDRHPSATPIPSKIL